MSLEKFYRSCGTPKGTPRRIVKGRKLRMAKAVIRDVRATCVERDGFCRVIGFVLLGLCSGSSEWAHLGASKRFNTRGQPPAERHTTRGSLMLCTHHHQLYDAHQLEIEPITADGADGLLKVWYEDETAIV